MTDQIEETSRPMSGTPAAREPHGQAAEAHALTEFKRHARASWAAGDYSAIAERELWPLGERIVARAGIRAGEDVLDVGCGTGNAAIRAAQAGARVVGLDLTPELFEPGRRLAAAHGVEVEWVEGDAEALPFEDASFDAAVSVLGAMFAPRHRVVADELVRVLRPDGRLVLFSWTRDGLMSRIFATVGRYLPPLPSFAAPPVLWGAEDHVRELFRGAPIDIQFERGVLELPPFESAHDDVEFHSRRFGPLVMARALTEADGHWPALFAELLPLHESHTAVDYLVVVGRRHRADETSG